MKRLKIYLIIICLLCVFLLSGCGGQKTLDIRYYKLEEKILLQDNYNKKVNTVLKRNNLNDVRLFYQQLRFYVPLNDTEVISIHVIKGIENSFTINCYLSRYDKEDILRGVDLRLFTDLVNTFSKDKIKETVLYEFVSDPNGIYEINSNESVKKQEDSELYFHIYSEVEYLIVLDITGNIRDDIDFYSFFALMENIYLKYDMPITPCDYGVNYQITKSDDCHIEYGFSSSVYTDTGLNGHNVFTIDYSNQLKDKSEAIVNIDFTLFTDIVNIFSDFEITETMIEEFLNDESGVYKENDEFYLISKNYNSQYDSSWDITYFLASHLTETLTYFGIIFRDVN